jgi:carbon-monoxide dehydrogenase large subunit
MLPGPYRFDRAGARVRGVVPTTTPTGSCRGFGQPEATWTRERLIDGPRGGSISTWWSCGCAT